MKTLPKMIALGCLMFTQACIPSYTELTNANGQELVVLFYPGGEVIPDLLIINGVNHFGSAQYTFGDPLADIGFRFQTGEKVNAECVSARKDILGEDECAVFQVYRSDFDAFPVGTNIPNPGMG